MIYHVKIKNELIKIDTNKRQEWECNHYLEDGRNICIWTGNDRGHYYFGLLIRENLKVFGISKFAQITQDKFTECLELPLDWRCIIDLEFKTLKNNAQWKWNFNTNEWEKGANSLELLQTIY